MGCWLLGIRRSLDVRTQPIALALSRALHALSSPMHLALRIARARARSRHRGPGD